MLAKRFGKLPSTVTKRIARMSDAEVEELVLAMLDAGSLGDLFEVTTPDRGSRVARQGR